jgi:hypothetical protein
LAYYHYNYEITYEDIPLWNKIEERLHGFHKWQNASKAKKKMNVKEKAWIGVPHITKKQKMSFNIGKVEIEQSRNVHLCILYTTN